MCQYNRHIAVCIILWIMTVILAVGFTILFGGAVRDILKSFRKIGLKLTNDQILWGLGFSFLLAAEILAACAGMISCKVLFLLFAVNLIAGIAVMTIIDHFFPEKEKTKEV